MSFFWGSHKFKLHSAFHAFLATLKGKKLRVEDSTKEGTRTITDQDGLAIDTQKLHKVVRAKAPVIYKEKKKPTLAQKLQEAREKDGQIQE